MSMVWMRSPGWTGPAAGLGVVSISPPFEWMCTICIYPFHPERSRRRTRFFEGSGFFLFLLFLALPFPPGKSTTKAQRHEDFRIFPNKTWCRGAFVVKSLALSR
jgi:hypothetical protein